MCVQVLRKDVAWSLSGAAIWRRPTGSNNARERRRQPDQSHDQLPEIGRYAAALSGRTKGQMAARTAHASAAPRVAPMQSAAQKARSHRTRGKRSTRMQARASTRAECAPCRAMLESGALETAIRTRRHGRAGVAARTARAGPRCPASSITSSAPVSSWPTKPEPSSFGVSGRSARGAARSSLERQVG